jgi:KipI family sensor histidine kinase inhibitor
MPTIVAACDRALLVSFSDGIDPASSRAVRGLLAALAHDPIAGVVDLHPAYASVLVSFDPLRVAAPDLAAALQARARTAPDVPEAAPRTVVVPVRYGGAFGPDLDEVARGAGLTPAEVVRRHSGASYEVAFLGFAPGFPYLAGAGIYPVASPGGWNVLGRTDLVLFDPARTPATLLAPGDRVRFVVEHGP